MAAIALAALMRRTLPSRAQASVVTGVPCRVNLQCRGRQESEVEVEGEVEVGIEVVMR